MLILQDIPLSELLWYKIGGKARYLLQCATKEDVLEALNFITLKNIKKMFICGMGSNLVFTDGYFDGCVIQLIHGQNEQIIIKKNGLIEAFAGETLGHVIEFGLKNNLTGMEFAGGLPGTVGAAVRGNVGAFGGETKDVISSAEVLVINENNSFEIKTFTNEELRFVYRGSIIKASQNRMIVLSAQFALKLSSAEETAKANEVYEQNINYRKQKHPLEYPNCGSVFKNIREPAQVEKILQVYPELKDKVEKQWYGKVAAGFLIQKLGLQGYKVGDAQISMKHALFIVNLGHAKASDVLSVIDTVQKKFMETFGFTLEPEVEIVN